MAVRKKKRKPVNVELIPEFADGVRTEPYAILDRIRLLYHAELSAAKILMVWRTGWTPDKDGRLIVAQIKLATAEEREVYGNAVDAIIRVNKDVWEHAEWLALQKDATIDHELCHLRPALDDEGDQIKDSRDRLVWRVRKHDLEEFTAIVSRHGLYVANLERFARAILDRPR